MQAVEVTEPEAGFQTVQRDIPSPGPEEIRIAVEGCGLCHGDAAVLEGRPPIEYPRTPGHEIAGRVNSVGEAVSMWSVGTRVAVGWHGGHCSECPQCRHGDFVLCENREITGILRDGGFAEFVTVPQEAVIEVPEAIELLSAGPLVCAGTTAFNALRNSKARAGDTVAVQGIGGVGHLAVQYADAFGCETVAVSRDSKKREAAFDLGADHYIDAGADDPATALQEIGGADVVLATAPSSAAIESIAGGLAPNGQLLAVSAPDDPVEIDVARLLGNRWSLTGWSAGHAADSRDALEMAARESIEPWIETAGLNEIEHAFDRMRSSEVRFRTVIQP